ncbi:hypothetical protein D3C71_05980 [compost metagenome]
MRENLLEILNNYIPYYGDNGHEITRKIKSDLPKIIFDIIAQPERYLVRGSYGAGNWANIPWVAAFDLLVTDSPQTGYYPVFLFRDDMSGVYLSLNQGVTKIQEKYKRDTKQVLKLKAEDYVSQIKDFFGFNSEEIILKRNEKTNNRLPSLYQAGNIVSKFYPSDNLPSEEDLQKDLKNILIIYQQIYINDNIPLNNSDDGQEEFEFKDFENLNKFRFHKRIERNYKLSKKVKEIQGYICKACDVDLESRYGEIGKEYIEAHHLNPISTLTGEKIELDARKDFTVLCANCHRMIHRLEDPSDLQELRRIIEQHKQ